MNPSSGFCIVASCLLATGCAAQRVAPPRLTSAIATVDPVGATPLYSEAVALDRAGRLDEAVGAYRRAELRYGVARPRGASLAIYGRARALDRAGRCREAGVAYGQYAKLVGAIDPVSAQMALRMGPLCYEPATPDPAAAAVTVALVAGEGEEALRLVDEHLANAESATPWLTYDRGVALAALGRVNEAAVTFQAAQGAFDGSEEDRSGSAGLPGKQLAVYGKARALSEGYRCNEARAAYDEYAALVRTTDPDDARRVSAYGGDCR
jgi:tetratricopeptide (TPR) repeat protein